VLFAGFGRLNAVYTNPHRGHSLARLASMSPSLDMNAPGTVRSHPPDIGTRTAEIHGQRDPAYKSLDLH
jgi:hypothetical protein